jgi:ribonuclease HI
MPKRKKRRPAPNTHLSEGPLPARFGDQFASQLLVFCDASRRRHGGLASVLFSEACAPPMTSSRTVPAIGSNELELQAALFALFHAGEHFPLRTLVLFSDNQDAVSRLARAKDQGCEQDPALATILPGLDLADALGRASFRWLKGHSSCRGNAIADELAAAAARSP